MQTPSQPRRPFTFVSSLHLYFSVVPSGIYLVHILMSLCPDDKRGRGGGARSASKDNRDRSRSRNAVRFDGAPSTTSKLSKKSKSARFADEDEEDDEENNENGVVTSPSVAMPTMPSFPGSLAGNGENWQTDVRRPSSKSKLANRVADKDTSSSSESEEEDELYSKSRQTARRSDQTRGDSVRSPTSERKAGSRLSDDLAYGDISRVKSSQSVPYPEESSFMPQWPSEDLSKGQMSFPGYAQPEPYRYAEPPGKLTYNAKPNSSKEYRQTTEPRKHSMPTRSVSFSQHNDAHGHRSPPERKSNHLSVGGSGFEKREPSPARGHGSRLGHLSVDTNNASKHDSRGGAPPASPLLEAYHGTYQSISPMPSPIMVAEGEDMEDIPAMRLSRTEDDEDEDDPSSDEEDIDREEKEHSARKSKLETHGGKKRIKLYDAEDDAEKLASALNHREARPGPLIDILPILNHDNILALRNEYKKRVKIQGRGVNLAKQIKAGTTGNFSKICYATALGKWESEAYWANFWYQAHSANRELLIESLMGRSNADIREIKDCFSDKRYHDDLSLCMQKELKPDKFRSAVLMALEGQRQEETDVYPPEYRTKDAEVLHRALKGRQGGESAILEVVVTRSNNHLREVLRKYEKTYQENFAREALRKSNNLVVSFDPRSFSC